MGKQRQTTSSSKRVETTSRAIGKLCVGGDWACAHGELEALADVAEHLAVYTPEPLHRELVELSHLCRTDPEEAAAVWVRLKQQVLHRAPPPS